MNSSASFFCQLLIGLQLYHRETYTTKILDYILYDLYQVKIPCLKHNSGHCQRRFQGGNEMLYGLPRELEQVYKVDNNCENGGIWEWWSNTATFKWDGCEAQRLQHLVWRLRWRSSDGTLYSSNWETTQTKLWRL